MNKVLSAIYIIYGILKLIGGPIAITVFSPFFGSSIALGIALAVLEGLVLIAVGVAIWKEKKWSYIAALIINLLLLIKVTGPTILSLSGMDLGLILFFLLQPGSSIPIITTPFLLIQFLRKIQTKTRSDDNSPS